MYNQSEGLLYWEVNPVEFKFEGMNISSERDISFLRIDYTTLLYW